MRRTQHPSSPTRRFAIGALVVALTLLSASACAGTPADDAPVEEPVAQETQEAHETIEPTPVDTEPPAPAPVLTHAWSDSDGYSFTLTMDSAEVTATSDVVNAKPGEAEISFSPTSGGTIANTTPARNADVPGAMSFIPIWPAGSTVCKYFVEATGGHEDWCSAKPNSGGGIMMFPKEANLEEGGSTTVSVPQAVPIKFTVEEADADAIVSELNAPGGWMLTLMDTTQPLGDCFAYWNSRDVAASTVPLECAQ